MRKIKENYKKNREKIRKPLENKGKHRKAKEKH